MIGLEEFAKQARTFLGSHVPARPASTSREWGEGSDEVVSIGSNEHETPEARESVINFRRMLFDNGYGWISGPVEFGGMGLSPHHDEVFNEVLAEFEVPDQGLFQVSRGMVSPAIYEHGTDDLKKRFLPGIHRGDIVCSQLLSEPEAGSDLAGLRTTAVRDGDEWVVNGQKVWSSYAHVAHYGQLLARTDPNVPKHQGLTMFMLPLNTPGVEIRPLRQMNGQAHFNEVFLTNVRVPHENRVGEPGMGWRAILTTLMNERHVVANRGGTTTVSPTERLFELARHRGVIADPIVRKRLTEVYLYDEIIRMLRLRQEAAVAAGRELGPEGSITKLLYTSQLRRIGSVAGELLGPAMVADSGEWGTYTWSRFLTGAPGLRIAGGTDEIQRNTISERALGLPKEPAPK
jgi:acyl-CoA dehydrogenase